MKKTINFLLIILLILIVSGCDFIQSDFQKINKYIVKNTPTELEHTHKFIEEVEGYQFSIQYYFEDESLVKDNKLFYLETEDLNTTLYYEITIGDEVKKFELSVVLIGNDTGESINKISDYILENTPNVLENAYEFIEEVEGYDFLITYYFEDESLVEENTLMYFEETDQSATLFFDITFREATKTFELDVVLKGESNDKRISKIANYIIENTPKQTTSDLDLIDSYLNYDFEIEYISDEPMYLSHNGEIVRTGSDRRVLLNFNITYKNITEGYDMSVLITKIGGTSQIDDIKDWLDEYMEDILASESGVLPKYDGLYHHELEWVSNQPGVLDDANNVRPALTVSDVVLKAVLKIGLKTHELTYEYKSAGLKPQNKQEYIDNFFKNLMPSEIDFRANIIYSDELEIIQSIVSPNTVNPLRPKDPNDPNKGRKMPGGPMWVVIHDTGNPGKGADAEMHNRYIHNQANSASGRVASWHYTVDDRIIYQHVPDDEQAWHAGDNDQGRLQYGNRNGIGIETCINPENDYELTLRRTAKLTAQLLYKHNLGLENVTQHYDFSAKNCPNIIRSNGWWPDFLKMVERELFLIMVKDNKDNSHVLKWTIDKPELLSLNGRRANGIVNDEIVNISLEVEIEDFKNTYEYSVKILGLTTEEKLSRISNVLYTNTAVSISDDHELITEIKEYNATISWLSSHPDIFTSEGKYTKPEKRTVVTLTALIKMGNRTFRRTYNIVLT